MSTVAATPHFALPAGVSIPSDKVLRILLSRPPAIIKAHTPIYRAVRDLENVWPSTVSRTYRFGPPSETFDAAGKPPFHWIYAADHRMTAVLEARFIGTSAREPHRFYIDPNATKRGMLATIDVARNLHLVDLTAVTGGLAGLYDLISHPDYVACQWLGFRLHELGFATGTTFDGMLYPSRIRRTATAIAISSIRMGDIQAGSTVATAKFRGSAEYKELMMDKLRIKSP